MTKVWFVTGSNSGIGAGIVQALVRIAGMAAPLKLFVAGSDAVAVLTPIAEERLHAIKDNVALSSATDGVE